MEIAKRCPVCYMLKGYESSLCICNKLDYKRDRDSIKQHHSHKGFHINDRVIINNPGAIYDSYSLMANALKIEKWVTGSLPKGTKGIITKIAEHGDWRSDFLALVRTEESYDTMVGLKGLKIDKENPSFEF